MEVRFGKALEVLEQLMEGKRPKEIAYNLKVNQSVVTDVKRMFPLFTGLTRPYRARTEASE